MIYLFFCFSCIWDVLVFHNDPHKHFLSCFQAQSRYPKSDRIWKLISAHFLCREERQTWDKGRLSIYSFFFLWNDSTITINNVILFVFICSFTMILYLLGSYMSRFYPLALGRLLFLELRVTLHHQRLLA